MRGPWSELDRGSLAKSGVTLLELLLVMFLLSLLFGAGLGMFAALDTGKRTASGSLKNVLRIARNTASASQAPARVLVDVSRGEFTVRGLKVVGTWRFENHRLQGTGILGKVDSELFHGDGFIGDALSFADRRGTVASLPVQSDPAFDFRDGFAIECVVRREGVGGGRLLSIGSSLSLEVGQAGEVRGRFLAPRMGATGGDSQAARPRAPEPRIRESKDSDRRRNAAGGAAVVTSAPGSVVPETWTRLRFSYDRRELVLEVDGVRVGVLEETAPVAPIEGPLVLSDERRVFQGSIDDLVVSAMVTGEPLRLEPSVRLVEAPGVIYFAAGGGLDRRMHTEPVDFLLEFEDGKRHRITVGLFGTVDG